MCLALASFSNLNQYNHSLVIDRIPLFLKSQSQKAALSSNNKDEHSQLGLLSEGTAGLFSLGGIAGLTFLSCSTERFPK